MVELRCEFTIDRLTRNKITMGKLVIDFIAREPHWRIVLVEEGPWSESEIDSNLRRVLARLYDCMDAIIDGSLAKEFPDSVGKPLLIQLDCYNLPEAEVRSFFAGFSADALNLPDYKAALVNNPFVSGVAFDLKYSHR